MIIGSERTWYLYAGLLGTVPVITGIATTFLWGYLADRVGRRRLLAAAVFFGEIPCFLTAFARNYYELLLLRALTGIGINGAAPAARAMIADLYPPDERGKGYALYNFSTGFGVLIGMAMAGAIQWSWRLPFMLAAAPNFLLVPLFLLTVKEVGIGYSEPELRRLYEVGAEYRFRIRLRDFAAALAATPTLIFIYLQGIPGTFPWGAIPYWAPTYFQKRWGLSQGTATLIVIVAGLGMMAGYFIGGMLTDHLVRKGVRRSRLLIALRRDPHRHGGGDSAAQLPLPVWQRIARGTATRSGLQPTRNGIRDVRSPERAGDPKRGIPTRAPRNDLRALQHNRQHRVGYRTYDREHSDLVLRPAGD